MKELSQQIFTVGNELYIKSAYGNITKNDCFKVETKLGELADEVKQALAPKTFYLWRNGIWNDQEELDDELFTLYNEQEQSYDRIDELVANAYDNNVDKVELSYDEFIEHLKDYKYNKRGY